MRRIGTRLLAAVLVVVGLSLAEARPAAAVGIGLGGIDAGITVYPDLASCAHVSYPRPTTFVGEYTATGVLYGPGAIVLPVAGARPITGINATGWSACLPGGYAGATGGSVLYTLSVTSPTGYEYVEVVQCTVTFGTKTCV